MERLTRFRIDCDTFSNDEFNTFTQKLYKIYDKQSIIITSLYHLLLSEYKTNKSNHIDKFDKITTEIIDERNNKKKRNKNAEIISQQQRDLMIHDIPSVLISCFASYLSLYDAINLEKCSRYLHYSCNSIPTTITTFPAGKYHGGTEDLFERYKANYGFYFPKFRCESMEKFKMVKNIEMNDLSEFDSITNYCKNFEYFVWNKLEKLHISEVDIGDVCNFCNCYSDLINKMDIKHLQFETLKIELTDANIYNYAVRVKSDFNILQLFTMNTNINLLGFPIFPEWFNEDNWFMTKLHRQIDYNILHTLALKGLSVPNFGREVGKNRDIFDGIIQHISFKNMESFHITNISPVLQKKSKTDLKRMKELCFSATCLNGAVNLLKKCPNLRRIKICEDYYDAQFKKLFETMFTFQSHLESVCIDTHSGCDKFNSEFDNKLLTAFVDAVAEQLKKNNGHPVYKHFKLKVDSYLRAKNLQLVSQVIAKLEKFVEKDWMLQIRLGEEVLGKMGNLKNKYAVHHPAMYAFTVINNKNNNMCGYNERWIMPCNHNEVCI